jgi:hypothetical protein
MGLVTPKISVAWAAEIDAFFPRQGMDDLICLAFHFVSPFVGQAPAFDASEEVQQMQPAGEARVMCGRQ